MYIYVHIPFCKSRCIYCDFYVVLAKYGGQSAYVDALLEEIDLRFGNPALDREPVEAIYVGGGTPSLLPADAYRRLFNRIRQYVPISGGAEITLEANPLAMADDPQKYLYAGFNRLSIGVQSFNDTELKRLSRIHSADEAARFIGQMRQAGFENVSIDLMYAIPAQTQATWRQTLDRAVKLDVQHVSMYGLKIEESTPLSRLSAFGAYRPPSEDENVAMYFDALDVLKKAGFHRYEFSNLARPGFESRHNLNYWNNGEFLALGASAHGYVGGHRYETVRDLAAYLNNPLAGESHPCSLTEQLENALIFGLRKADGVDIADIEAQYGIDFETVYGHVVTKYAADNLLVYSTRNGSKQLRLTEKAIPVSNAVLADFLLDAPVC